MVSTTLVVFVLSAMVAVVLGGGLPPTPPPGPNPCVSDCSGKANGDYQACGNCSNYVSCSNQVLYTRSCPAGMKWDDNKGTCDFTSSTCPPGSPTSCVASCVGKSDGDYQSCIGCHVYVSCSGETMYDNRACAPGNLVWDDTAKECLYNSTTCTEEGPD